MPGKSKSMLHYLSSLIPHGHVPQRIGTAQIGYTTYVAGEFVTLPRKLDSSTRAYQEGQRMTQPETRWVLMPCLRTDWTRKGDYSTPDLLPASYQRSSRTTYQDARGKDYYVAGWSGDQGTLWLSDAGWMKDDPTEMNRPVKSIGWRWDMSYVESVELAREDIRQEIEELARG